ncbi:MAG TPA: hypothetical protein VK866_04445, partial [Acidimicrobiales bacterium]|nr:hypothetical protein [Acidimicrobiales bacterium]
MATVLTDLLTDDTDVAAVVSRGGRLDPAGEHLARVAAPTLLIVGGHDRRMLALNRDAAAHLRAEHRLEVVPGATHLFEEPGTLEAGRRPQPRGDPDAASAGFFRQKW